MASRFTVSALCAIRSLPTPVEPVKETMSTCGAAISGAITVSGVPKSSVTAPGGRPASRQHCTMAATLPGDSSAGRRMTLHPAASARQSLRVERLMGKFQAVSASAMPTGS